MKNLRRWELVPDDPFSLYLAADARLSQTDYTDDQIWTLLIGRGDDAAFALQTKYGGRAGLASLVPMWTHDNRIIYQAQTYHQAPVITAFAPNYMAASAVLLPGVTVDVEHIAFDSHVLGGIYTVTNDTEKEVKLRLELFGHVGRRGKEEKLAIITMADGNHALSMGQLGQLAPVVLLENGQATTITSRSASPKIGTDFAMRAGETVTLRFVHAGLRNIRSSLAEARRWLIVDWQAFRDSIDNAALAIPTIQTGDLGWDAVVASSYNRLVQAFFRPAGIFPRETFVAGRTPEYGYSKRGDGGDHPRMWEGQSPDLAYLLTSVMAGIDPSFAVGALRNYIALQKDDGFIDLKPGPAGQKHDLLCTPLLARIAWNIYLQTRDTQFLEEIYPSLQRFFDRWLQEDADQDGVPEWQHERQTRYIAFPAFGRGRLWAQGADIRKAETPDLLSYLLSEAHALKAITTVIGDKAAAKAISATIKTFTNTLKEFWDGDHYSYRDRDTNITTTGSLLLEGGIGDQPHHIKRRLAAPNRVIVTILGGVSHVPNITLHVEGVDRDGNMVTESVQADKLLWQNRTGIYTTETIFSEVTTVRCDGLSRVYRIGVGTMDTTDLDINGIMPLISSVVPAANRKKLVKLALDKKHFLRPQGITMASAKESIFDPSNAEGAGGIWLYWQSLLGEALLDEGEGSKVTDIVKSIFNMQQAILSQEHRFAQFYNSDEAMGLGEKDHIAGIAPLLLFQRLYGIRVLSNEKVMLDAKFAWGRGITVRHHDVYVRRTSKRIKVEFPSGHTVELDAPLSADQIIEDPEPVAPVAIAPIALSDSIRASIPDAKPPTSKTQRVIIEVQQED